MSAPQSRRERPSKPALTREGIIDTAVSLMEQEGLRRVTVRRLAQALDTGPASLYVYLANTAELHAAILDRLIGRVDLQAARNTEIRWRERLYDVLAGYQQVLFDNSALALPALSTRPSGENHLALLETLLALLAEGGASDLQAAWGVDILLQSAAASAAEISVRRGDSNAEADWARLRRALAGASGEVHPHIHAQADNLTSGTPTERRRWIVDMLLNGILSTNPDGGTGR